MKKSARFPRNFYWGTATSSHQIEGGTRNNWSVWEEKNAARLAHTAHQKWSQATQERFPEMFQPENYISGRACDHYHRYEEDLDLVRRGGQNAFRFSLEWSRIEPEEGVFDDAALAHYRDVVRACRARGLEPFVTLWHWTHPLWLEARGGVTSRDFIPCFVRYARRVAEVFGEEVRFYMTLNEPTSVIGNAYLAGNWPPQRRNPLLAWRALRTLGTAHCRAYDALRDVAPHAQVGFTHIYVFNEPFRKNNVLDQAAVRLKNFFDNGLMQHYGRGKQDFVALQYYFHNRVQFPLKKRNANKVLSDLEWEVYPEGIYHAIMDAQRFGVPIYITESGIADAEDSRRPQFLREMLAHVAHALADGADVRGYFYWSLLDNFEWDKGFWPRFGLVAVDYDTLIRTPRESYTVYRDLIAEYSEK